MQKETKRSKTRLGDEPPPPPSAVHVHHLPEDLVTEILTRLPSKSVLRFRAVSRAWRRITTDPAFLAAHARRRPLELLLLSLVTVPHDHREGYGLDAVLDTVPVSADQQAGRRRLIRYTSTWEPFHFCLVKASCDGVLLLKVGGFSYLICNPMTRQWTELPRLPELNRSVSHEYGFYHHQPSGEYRLLCRYSTWTTTAQHAYYILSAAATEPRLLSMEDDEVTTGISLGYAPVALHGRLHWLQCPIPCGSRIGDRMVVFDTESETFHLRTPPPTSSTRVKIFAMERLLAAADFTNRMQIDLWFLQDYDGANGRWERRHQIATSPIYAQLRAAHPNLGSRSLYTVVAATDEGGIILRATNDGLVVYNVKKRMSRVVTVSEGNNSVLMCHVFRESLVQHEGFKVCPSDGLPLIKFSWSPA